MKSTGKRAVVCLGWLFLAASARVRGADTVVGKYNGAGGCAASSCHGSIQPKTVTRVPQNEYSIWAGQDKHARAYQVLSNSVSVRIGKILRLEHPPAQTSRCLACHALAIPPEQRAQTFDISDGVSCESCHGPASGWLGQHTIKDWPHERSVKELGMLDMRDLVQRSERCLTCHLGTSEKFVDHELIAAGHPDLTFELNLFSAVEPKHWKEPEGVAWRGVQTWAVGEAVQLREGLDRLARRAHSNTWPEYSELDCFACHHALTQPDESWRLTTEGYFRDRTVGVPAWNPSRYSVFRFALHELNADAEAQLSADVTKLTSLLGVLSGNRDEIASTAQRAATIAAQLAGQLNSKPYDAVYTVRVMRDIAANGEPISVQGQRAAEQAAMALDSLFVAYKQNVSGANERELRTAIDQLFQQLDNPSAYNAPRFAAQMQKVSALLPRA
jgi:Cytochrome c554 and c-prime